MGVPARRATTSEELREALDEALSLARPEIFNSDQGSQFTAAAFTSRLEGCGIAASMDGRGRALDNVFVERLWRSVKYEEVYLREYADGWEAEERLAALLGYQYALKGASRASHWGVPGLLWIEQGDAGQHLHDPEGQDEACGQLGDGDRTVGLA